MFFHPGKEVALVYLISLALFLFMHFIPKALRPNCLGFYYTDSYKKSLYGSLLVVLIVICSNKIISSILLFFIAIYLLNKYLGGVKKLKREEGVDLKLVYIGVCLSFFTVIGHLVFQKHQASTLNIAFLNLIPIYLVFTEYLLWFFLFRKKQTSMTLEKKIKFVAAYLLAAFSTVNLLAMKVFFEIDTMFHYANKLICFILLISIYFDIIAKAVKPETILLKSYKSISKAYILTASFMVVLIILLGRYLTGLSIGNLIVLEVIIAIVCAEAPIIFKQLKGDNKDYAYYSFGLTFPMLQFIA